MLTEEHPQGFKTLSTFFCLVLLNCLGYKYTCKEGIWQKDIYSKSDKKLTLNRYIFSFQILLASNLQNFRNVGPCLTTEDMEEM